MIKIENNGYKYSMSQTNYIECILSKFNITNTCKAKTLCTWDIINENKTPFEKKKL